MNIKNSDSVYPSYRNIQQQIQQKYIHNYQQKIQSLKTRLAELENQHHFDQDHQNIKASILNLSTENPLHHTQSQDRIKVHERQKPSVLATHPAESLNYYIEDDGEEQSNYETYLKFKKKALERDLEEEQLSKIELNNQQKKKRKQEEELFFRKLYVNEHHKETSGWKKQSNYQKLLKKQKKQGYSYQEAKNTATNFLNKVQRGNFKTSQKDEKHASARKKGIEGELEAFQKNRKYLKENYFEIIKKLEGTNIVKWRILNDDLAKCH